MRRAALCPDGPHPIFGSQTQEGPRCFLHRGNRALLKLAAAFPEEPHHSGLITNSGMDTKHRERAGSWPRWDPQGQADAAIGDKQVSKADTREHRLP